MISLFYWLRYKLFARHKYGHGIHSPFLYKFIRDVLLPEKYAEIFKANEEIFWKVNQNSLSIEELEIGTFGMYVKEIYSLQMKYRRLLSNLAAYQLLYFSRKGENYAIFRSADEFFKKDINEQFVTAIWFIRNISDITAEEKNKIFELINKSEEKAVIVAGGIYKTREASNFWKELKALEKVTLTVDLYEYGLLFFRKELRKENYVIKY